MRLETVVLFIALIMGLQAKFVIDLNDNSNDSEKVVHEGHCPIHMYHCNVMCMGDMSQRGCKFNDGNCPNHQKCCAPACGCSPQCVDAAKTANPFPNKG
ncbi:unnamed protein product [Didymodactylos carnosus]|uniref:WAP domain-containing protein n=2 Tax=Didymodactylos carnosus TaxID=1234261 RepID=A0A815ETD4_9BILA|nr:unnamed protein product [Didymodactylos carnosus]CAF4164547.1 unnamed protein product [Didymodactylos carnosus]